MTFHVERTAPNAVVTGWPVVAGTTHPVIPVDPWPLPPQALERVTCHRNRYQPASEVRKVLPVDLTDITDTPALTAEKCPGCGCNARPYTGSPPHASHCPYR